jgi:hypothetical protein
MNWADTLRATARAALTEDRAHFRARRIALDAARRLAHAPDPAARVHTPDPGVRPRHPAPSPHRKA